MYIQQRDEIDKLKNEISKTKAKLQREIEEKKHVEKYLKEEIKVIDNFKMDNQNCSTRLNLITRALKNDYNKKEEALDLKMKEIQKENENLNGIIKQEAIFVKDFKQLNKEIMLQQQIYKSLYNQNNTNPIQKITLVVEAWNHPADPDKITMVTLQSNLLNPFIEKVVLLCEKEDVSEYEKLIESQKIIYVKNSKRATIAQILYAINNIKELNQKIVMISNNDIIFDQSLINFRDFNTQKNVMWALSRRRSLYDLTYGVPKEDNIVHHPDMCFFYIGSHDSFAFKLPVSKALIEHNRDYYLGEFGSENRLIHSFAFHKYEVNNPCFKINAWHYQLSVYSSAKPKRRVNNGGLSALKDPDMFDRKKLPKLASYIRVIQTE